MPRFHFQRVGFESVTLWNAGPSVLIDIFDIRKHNFGPAMSAQTPHQCLIYEGSPSRYLPALASLLTQKLNANYRCLYMNSPAMVAGMRSHLAAAGVDIPQQVKKTSLVMSSDQDHLVDGRFDVDRMMHTLGDAVRQAVKDGYAGLWATGDMTWELGPQRDFSKLLEYEWRLEAFFRTYSALSGVCQYHADTLPRKVLRQAVLTHPSIFINETLSLINPRYLPANLYNDDAEKNPELESLIDKLTVPVEQ